VETGTLAFLPPDKFRREVKEKSLTVCDGITLWMYYPAFQKSKNTPSFQPHAPRIPHRYDRRPRPAGRRKRLLRQSEHLGPGYRVQLTPKTSALHRMVSRITLDLNPGLTADRMEIETSKDESSILTFSNEHHVKLSPSDFAFQPPAGVSVSEPLAK